MPGPERRNLPARLLLNEKIFPPCSTVRQVTEARSVPVGVTGSDELLSSSQFQKEKPHRKALATLPKDCLFSFL